MSKKEIAKKNQSAITQILGDEAAGFNPTPINIKISHQDGSFQVPGLPGEKRLSGIILASKMVRVFFPRMGDPKETEELLELTGKRPFCSSKDYLHGNLAQGLEHAEQGSPAGMLKQKIASGGLNCFDCPLEKWGSVEILGKPGNGKACAELRRLLFWRQGMTIPTILSVPISSIRAWDQYCSALASVGLNHNEVVTEIGLEVKSAPGMKWSVMNFAKAGDIDDEVIEELTAEVAYGGAKLPLARGLLQLFKNRELSAEDYPENGKSESEEEF